MWMFEKCTPTNVSRFKNWKKCQGMCAFCKQCTLENAQIFQLSTQVGACCGKLRNLVIMRLTDFQISLLPWFKSMLIWKGAFSPESYSIWQGQCDYLLCKACAHKTYINSCMLCVAIDDDSTWLTWQQPDTHWMRVISSLLNLWELLGHPQHLLKFWCLKVKSWHYRQQSCYQDHILKVFPQCFWQFSSNKRDNSWVFCCF